MLLLLFSSIASFGVELVYARSAGLPSARGFVSELPIGVLALNVLLFLCIALVLYALFNSFVAASIGVGTIASLAAFSNSEKMRLRGEPLYPADTSYLLSVDFLIESIGPSSTVFVLAAMLALAGAAVAWRLMRRALPTSVGWNSSFWSTSGWRSRLACAIIGVGYLTVVAQFNSAGDPTIRLAYESAGSHWVSWSQNTNYERNGFVAGWLNNLPGPAMSPPPGYSEQRVAEVVARYEALAADANLDRDGAALAGTNIVVVLSESFADPTLWEGVTPAEDPIPFTRELMNEHTSGTMLSSGYGGGTANVEFEVFTGLSVREFESQARTPYQSVLPHRATFPSLIASFAEGHADEGPDATMIGVHPYESAFYQRSRVYPILGFDESFFIDDFIDADRATYVDNNSYVSDTEAFEWAIRELRSTDEPVVVGVLTMQNHAPYWDRYSDPIDIRERFEGVEQVEQYLRGLAYSDEALEDLVTDIESTGEPTVLLLFGDHLPSILPPDLTIGGVEYARYLTPYLVWSNVDRIDVGDKTVLGPNHLMTQVRETLRAPLTAMDAMLLELRQHIPAASPEFLLDPDGRVLESSQLSIAAQAVLEEYRMLQYHLVEGTGILADALFAVPEPVPSR
ncbi:LTA synthase family protein [Chryseoglobus sp. 28M-23]|uniref:LTA synthase family protein n=1 Tax=Chryseoglobus sp. 28M-23 TaxID=2772253 RepID=UPI00174640BD|nr:LTA synthase family protein [Chryseoglobus sp. 28M-23]QOD93259.1 LTA synthase family protein [Chryseoglobus sp. 28M-23]